jgi:diaminopimelate decarboxylase
LNSFRPFTYSARQLQCDGVDLAKLAGRFGTPLYVYSADQIRQRFGLFEKHFAKVPHTVCYSIKANSSLAIMRLLAQAGSAFDIVSGGELERVRAASKAALKRVVFSGVGKQAWEMDAALEADILLFNVESEAELDLLASRASKLGKPARIGLRVNPDVFAETHPYISTGLREHKFGIDVSVARKAYRTAVKSKWLQPVGVSVHIGSQIRSVDPFGAALARVASLVGELRSDGIDIRYVDTGGGLGVEYRNGAFHPDREVRAYATAIRKATAKLGVHLLLEPGRFIVAQAGALLTRVLYVKQNGSKTFVITDAAMNDLIRPALYQAHHEILPVKKAARTMQTVDVVGPVCESGDFFARDREMPVLDASDLAVLLDAGAYAMALASNYNTRPRPAEVLIDKGKARLVRKRETIQEMLAAESF